MKEKKRRIVTCKICRVFNRGKQGVDQKDWGRSQEFPARRTRKGGNWGEGGALPGDLVKKTGKKKKKK